MLGKSDTIIKKLTAVLKFPKLSDMYRKTSKSRLSKEETKE